MDSHVQDHLGHAVAQAALRGPQVHLDLGIEAALRKDTGGVRGLKGRVLDVEAAQAELPCALCHRAVALLAC